MNNEKKLRIIIITGIILLAIFLRLYKIDKVPPGLSWDETAIGYNAYSILETGKDEYGVDFPLLFKSFDDYKLPGYFYLTAISERIFGLNEFSVRFPSALLGVIAVLGMYFLAYELLNSSKLALFAAFLLSVSPWHLQFSRAAFEANGALTFIIWGTFLTMKGVRNPKLLIFGIPILFTSLYFYYAARFLSFLILLVVIYTYRSDLSKVKRHFISGIILSFFIILPLIPQFFSPEGFQRLRQVSILSSESITADFSIALSQNKNSLIANLVYNRRLAYAWAFVGNYLKHFSIDILFANGDRNPRHGVRGMGLLYLWELPLLIAGLYAIAKMTDKKKWIFLSWFLLGPIPASLSVESPHALRNLSTLPAFLLIETIGLSFILGKFKEKLSSPVIKSLLAISIIIVAQNILTYFYLYYDFTPPRTNLSWGDGNKQMVKKLTEVQGNYDQIFITGHYWKPYIYVLFYSQYNPALYHKVGTDKHFDKYFFGNTFWEKKGPELGEENLQNLAGVKKTLFILSQEEMELIDKEKTPYTIIYETLDSFGNPRFKFIELI